MLNNGGPSATISHNATIDPAPPASFTGFRCKNKFATQTEYVNNLFWRASLDPTVVSYLIFRNGVLIATIPASGQFKFIDHDRPKKQVDTYALIAVDASGLESSPVIITVP